MVDVGKAIGYLDLDTSGFKKGFASAFQDLKSFNDQSTSLNDKLATVGSSMSRVGSTMTKTVTVPIVGLGTAVTAVALKFESAMSQVQATMGITKDTMTTVNGQQVNAMEALSEAAQKMGATTKFSASEAAEGLNYMALAGYDVETSVKMLPIVLNLAAAGAMELGAASDMVTDAQTALGLSIEETTVMVDQMAKTASSSNTSVSQLGEAILTIGGTAKYMAGGTEELNTVLGILADNGIKGSEAGTHLRNMLLKLSAPTSDGAKVIEELGLRIFDTDGHMRKFADIFGDLGEKMKSFTDEQKIKVFSDLFNARDVAAANALLSTTSERWTELESKITSASGAAKDMADTQLDNLQGQLTILKSSLEGASIAFGNLLLPAIKKVIQIVQKVTDWINSLNKEQKEQVVRIAAIVAAIGPALLILGKLVTAVSAVIKVVQLLSTFLVTNPIMAVVAAIGLLVTGLVLLANANKEAAETTTYLSESQQKIIDSANASAEAFYNAKQAADELAASQLSEVEYAEQNLLPELESLIDSNGRVKEGYEARAQFILNQLNQAFGTEYKDISDLIDANGKFKDSIYEVIEAKKAQILLEAYEESYKDAILAVGDAEDAVAVKAQELAAVEKSVADKRTAYEEERVAYFKAMDSDLSDSQQYEAQKRYYAAKEAYENEVAILDEKKQEYQDTVDTYKDCIDTINDYEEASTLVLQGETDKAIDILRKGESGFVSYADTVGESAEEQKRILEEQVKNAEVKLGILEADYKANQENMTDAQKREAQKRIDDARKQAENAKTEYAKLGGNMVSGMVYGVDSHSWELTDSMQAAVDSAVSAGMRAIQTGISNIKASIATIKTDYDYLMEGILPGTPGTQTTKPAPDRETSPYSTAYYNYTFNSPVAVTPTTASKTMRQTSQQMAFGG